jgi:8-oxo-dGTP pyrophosphatase MutT (NUDIX family)
VTFADRRDRGRKGAASWFIDGVEVQARVLTGRTHSPFIQVPDMAAAIAYRRAPRGIQFLMIRTGAGRWVFPKGRIEPGESASRAAAREAWEEAGVAGRITPTPTTGFRLYKRLGRGPRVSIDVTAFLLEVQEQREPAETDRAPTWFPPDEARDALVAGRSPGEAAALARTIDVALQAIDGSR